jgi:hypothetical protein
VTGFVALDRSALDHPLLKDAERFRAWFWIVAKACWKDGEGTVEFTWDAFAAQMGWNKLSAKRCIALFDRHGMIAVEANAADVSVTILDRTTFSLIDSTSNGEGEITSALGFASSPKPVFGVERDAIPVHVRKAVAVRDGHKCAYCGDTAGPFEIDHILAVANGGGNELDNLCVACIPCNRSKGAKMLSDWQRP